MKIDSRRVHYAVAYFVGGQPITPCRRQNTPLKLRASRTWADVTCDRCKARRPK